MTPPSLEAIAATITVLVLLAAMMQTLDTTIVNVALPYVQGSVATSPDQITWVLTSYITAAAIMTPPTGFLVASLRSQAPVYRLDARLHARLDALRHG